MVFVSSDRLHRSCAPLFLRPDQEFLWGPDLKADLRANHEALMQLPEEQKMQGLIKMHPAPLPDSQRSEEHTSELQSLMRSSYAVFCLKKKKNSKIYIINS